MHRGNAASAAHADNVAPWSIKALGSKLKAQYRSQGLEIELHQHYTSKIYTSGSKIAGDLIIKPKRNVKFDKIRICLSGDAVVLHEDINAASLVSHNFLDLQMPVSPSSLPSLGILEMGQQYTVPFDFILPHRLPSALPPQSGKSESLIGHHSHLPPSMGMWERDDMAPHMTKVQYEIRASVIHNTTSGSMSEAVMEAHKTIMVIPSSQEDPPLTVGKLDVLYALTNTLPVRRSRFSKRLGTLNATATNATTIFLGVDGRTSGSSSIQVGLVYDPSDPESRPPPIGHVSAKVVSHTWSSAKSAKELPNLGSSGTPFLFRVSVEANSAHSGTWMEHGSLPEDEVDGEAASVPFYSTSLEVSFELPTSSRTFIPTFHSPRISRAYCVHLNIHVGGQSLELRAPLQIVMRGGSGQMECDEVLPSFEEACQA
ncbi:hypothetical protein AK830_g1648 [Neonectria ditissima]|uniref:Arrestin-like N-terminal domain-containing protein n=1 Tax=Neonectria ditissima TaxID=78410 RepID=A0A0P7B5N5_9HYPO|nr:hypothetical protein AK830_g1648 [Neonectria ditissima]